VTRSHPAVVADEAEIGADVTIASSARLESSFIRIGRGVSIADGVVLRADRIEIGDGCRLSPGISIVCPDISLGASTTIAERCTAEVNERLHVGAVSQVGARVRMVGQSIDIGERLWLTDDVVIGGGGARSRRATLTIGDRVAIMDRCLINLCREVVIGDESALSNGAVLLTHTMWHPLLRGGAPVAAPVRIGSDVIVFVNAVVAPGVTIGDGCTVAANALVIADVPDHRLAIGNPARVMALVPPYPRALPAERQDAAMRSILDDYAEDVAVKGLSARALGPGVIAISGDGWTETLRYLGFDETGGASAGADVTLACRATADAERGACHFDLTAGRMIGAPTRVSEDLRDFLRRQAIRIFVDRPFQGLPPANVARLKARGASHD
jgi:acetyltransferase-like isoleucine patch superfamily enzyme